MKHIFKITLLYCLIFSQYSYAQMILVYNLPGPYTSVTLPLDGKVNVKINWGDGTPLEIVTVTGLKSHNYNNPIAIQRTITITGTLTKYGSTNNYPSNSYSGLTKVLKWDSLGLESLSHAFGVAAKLIQLPANLPPTVTDLSFMFDNATSFNQDISSWNTSNVKDMSYMFLGATSFNKPLGTWDTRSVKDMYGMFIGANSFNQPLGTWNISQVTNTGGMFSGALSFNQPLENWDVSSTIDMRQMFWGAKAFNQNLGLWGSKLKAKVLLGGLLDSTALSISNYDKTLIGFSLSTITSINLGAAGLNYCSSENERLNLITSTLLGGKGWTINDKGKLLSSPPTIISQPLSQQICQGNTALFSVSASGSNLSYKWSNDISTSNFMVTSLSGIYTVSVTGNCAIAISTAASLIVSTAPSIISQPVSQIVCSTTAAQFVVSASGSNLNYTWSNGASISPFMNTTLPGSYTVTVTGSCGIAISSTFSFDTTNCNAPISAMEIIFANLVTATFPGSSANITWPSLNAASTYCIQYSRTSNFSTTVKTICGLNTPSYLFELSTAGLREENTFDTIYYKVSGVDITGNKSRWSAVQFFVLRTGAVTANSNQEKSDGSIFYPNPNAGLFTIKNLPLSSDIEVYDILGVRVHFQKINSVETTISINLDPGIYQIKNNDWQAKLVIE